MARLVDSSRTALLRAHRHIAALQATYDTVDSGKEVLLCYAILIVTRSDKRRLVTYIGNIGTRKTRSLLSQELSIELIVKLQVLKMHIEDLLALLDIGQAYLNLTIETTSTHKRLIENIYTVGCRQDDNAGIGLETIHLGEELVEGVLPLVVARKA